jgi:hypothetical protein
VRPASRRLHAISQATVRSHAEGDDAFQFVWEALVTVRDYYASAVSRGFGILQQFS